MLKSSPEFLLEHYIVLPFILQALVMIGHDYLHESISYLNDWAIAS